ncbi:energy transducer TonB [Desulfosoma sp.]
MDSGAPKPNSFDRLSQRPWRTWLWAALTAGATNLLLFLLMPSLTNPAPARLSVETLVPQVNVVRAHRPETPVKRQIEKPPPESKPKPKPIEKPQTAPRQPVMAKLTLPFEINPRLPAGPHALALPVLEVAPLMPSGGLPGAFELGQLDKPLTVLARVPPPYPMDARRRGIEGWVRVLLFVDEAGRVDDVEILEAEPPGVFEESVRRCVVGWRFSPGTVEGVPVRAKVETTIRFELQ